MSFGSPAIPAPIADPSFLAVDSKRRFLYSVSEESDASTGPTGSVTAFAISADGSLDYLNTQPSGGDGPCHVSVDATDRQVLVANYSGGSVAILPIRSDGRLGEPTDVVHHRGSGPNPDRQQGPHPHSINVDPTNRFAFVPDLGTDEVATYRINLVLGLLTPADGLTASLAAGAGPRHFDFHPGGMYAYAINELDSTVTAFSYDGSTGALEELHTVSTLPDGFDGTNYPADVHVSPSGRFLYGSNRGHHSIAVFAIDQGSGTLTPLGHESVRGRVAAQLRHRSHRRVHARRQRAHRRHSDLQDRRRDGPARSDGPRGEGALAGLPAPRTPLGGAFKGLTASSPLTGED